MLMDSSDKVAAVKQLLLQMHDFNDARHLISSVLEDNRQDLLRLRRDLGHLVRPLLGQPNGYYVLDLSKEIDRLCLEKLVEISSTNAVMRCEQSKIAYGRTGDLSQRGAVSQGSTGGPISSSSGYSCFRNEMFNGMSVHVCAAFCSPIPLSGTLDFDFSCTYPAPRDAVCLSDVRVVKVLLNHFLLGKNRTQMSAACVLVVVYCIVSVFCSAVHRLRVV